MLTYAVVALGVAQILFLAKHWMRVTTRDRDAASRRKMRAGLDWARSGHRTRIAAGVPYHRELRGQ